MHLEIKGRLKQVFETVKHKDNVKMTYNNTSKYFKQICNRIHKTLLFVLTIFHSATYEKIKIDKRKWDFKIFVKY